MNYTNIRFRRTVGRMLCATLAFIALAACIKKETQTEQQKEHADKKDENIVTLTTENLKHVEIKTLPAALGSLEIILKAAGRVSENFNKTAKVASTLEGRLTRLNYDLNDHVKAGDVLALVQSPELLGRALELKAPIDGVITERKSTVGELVGKETEIFTISDPADLWVVAEIKERDIAAITTGQDAKFTVLAYPEEPFHGKIVRMGNRVEEDSRTLEARIDAINTDGRLKAGMFADVEIVTTLKENTLLIADTALQTEGEDLIIFVMLGEGRFEKRIVKTGMEQSGKVQILEGVKEGEQVVTIGSFILKSEMLKGELGEE